LTDYLTTAYASPYFFSSAILIPFFVSDVGKTLAVYGLKAFFD
jgi:hypothetical protein